MKLIHRLNIQDLATLRAISEATRQANLAKADFESARRWHDLRDKLDHALTQMELANAS